MIVLYVKARVVVWIVLEVVLVRCGIRESPTLTLELYYLLYYFGITLRRNRSDILYFQHARFAPIVGVGKRGPNQLVHGDLPRQHSLGTTLMFAGPVPADSRQ